METVVTTKDELILKWCFHCNFYELVKSVNSRFVCQKCNRIIADWVTKLVYRDKVSHPDN